MSSRPAWSNQRKLIVILFILALLPLLVQFFGGLLVLVIVAGILVYPLKPTVETIEEKLHFRPVTSILLAYLLMFLVLGVAVVLLGPALTRQDAGTGLVLPAFIAQA